MEACRPGCSHALLRLLLLLLSWMQRSTVAVVNLPGVEFNAATGQTAHASSYYDYKPNPVRDVVYVAQNAVDGFTDESSWWSSGEEDPAGGGVFWQLNMTRAPPTLKRIIIRWYGFLTPATYQVRVSYVGENFRTIANVVNETISYDRVDTITAGLDKVDTRFKFLRVDMQVPNVCQDIYSCEKDSIPDSLGTTNERVVYGIREFELWAIGNENSAHRSSGSAMALVVIAAFGYACGF